MWFICWFEGKSRPSLRSLSLRQTCYLPLTAVVSSAVSKAEETGGWHTFQDDSLCKEKPQLSPETSLSAFPHFRLIPRENDLAGWNLSAWPAEETFGRHFEYFSLSLSLSFQDGTASRESGKIIHVQILQQPPGSGSTLNQMFLISLLTSRSI